MLKNFFTIEGGEGTGKSTLCVRINQLLTERGIDNIISREPGGIQASEEIRAVIMNHELIKKSEVLLFAAARLEHLENKILPALASDKIVICDRYIDSSLAYQGQAQGLGIDEVLAINKYAIGDNFPEKTFLLDMDVEQALNRITSEREINRFDKRELQFHQAVREGYHKLAQMYPKRFVVLDGNLPTNQLAEIVLEHIC